jgi:hypothetical protein
MWDRGDFVAPKQPAELKISPIIMTLKTFANHENRSLFPGKSSSEK